MRQKSAVMGLVLLLAMRAATTEAQSTGGSFGGSRGFGGGSSSGSGSSSSSSGSGSSRSSSGSSWSGSSGSSSQGESESDRRRREEARRREEERLERERARREAERLERERLARELSRLPADRARSERFVGTFAFPPRPNVLVPDLGAAPRVTLAWWGGSAPGVYLPRERRWTNLTRAAVTLAFLAIAAAVIVRLRTIWKKPVPAPLPTATVRVLSVGIDWTRRRDVQQRLAAQSGTHDLSTAAGMFSAWRDVQSVLRASSSAVRYVSLSQTNPLVSDAGPAFEARASDLRGRYIIETVTDAARGIAPTLNARGEEGEGLVVVSVVAGFNRPLPEINATTALDAVIAALCGDDPEALVALQTVWSPTREDDRMSSAELEARYPELRRLDDGVGRVQCASCKAVWAKELGRCPACGAPPG